MGLLLSGNGQSITTHWTNYNIKLSGLNHILSNQNQILSNGSSIHAGWRPVPSHSSTGKREKGTVLSPIVPRRVTGLPASQWGQDLPRCGRAASLLRPPQTSLTRYGVLCRRHVAKR